MKQADIVEQLCNLTQKVRRLELALEAIIDRSKILHEAVIEVREIIDRESIKYTIDRFEKLGVPIKHESDDLTPRE